MMRSFSNNIIIREDMDSIYRSRVDWKELRNRNVYISGASGMIASYIVMFLIYLNELFNYNIEIYAGIRKLSKANERFGNFVYKPYFHVIPTDVILPVSEGQQWDYIIHAASLASPQYYGKMPVETMLPNIVGTYELLRYASKFAVTSFLFLSSGSVYGQLNNLNSITESTNGTFDFLSEGNEYGESKRCGEALCKAYYREYQVPTKSARIHHTYGPTLDIEHDTRVFAEFVNNVIHGHDIVLKSDGTSNRAFCYLVDTITALFTILLDGNNGESYNVGNDLEYVSIKELADMIITLCPDKKLQVISEKRETDGYVPSKDVSHIPLSIEKLKSLGWYPKYSIEEGFSRTICSLSENSVLNAE